MKKIFCCLLLILSFSAIMAQAVGYECTYQETMDLGDKLSQIPDEASREAVKGFLSKRKSFYTLTYSQGQSLFAKNTDLSDDDMGMGYSMPVYFIDYARQEKTTQINFFGRNFIIIDTLDNANWRITDETRTIAGHHCTKAEGDSNMVAWFSVETPIPAGPMSCYGLPGLVVELTVGPMTYTLTDIKPLQEAPKIKAPTKGKKVTQAELQEIIKQKLSEMGFDGTHSGSISIRM